MFTYILVLIVCLASVLTIIGIRKSITEYRNELDLTDRDNENEKR